MWTNLARIATSFAAVVAAYFVYAQIAVLLIGPQITKISGGTGGTNQGTDYAQEQREYLKNFFPPGSWQLERTKVLQSGRMTLLMKDFKELPGNMLELEPVTIIAFSSDDESERLKKPPLILEAEKALLRFDELDLAFGKLGQMQGGQLLGDVRIHRNMANPDASDALMIVTRDVQMTPERIETTSPVQFKMGMNSGSGRHLIAELAQKKGGAKKNGLNIEGLKSLYLMHVDRVQLAAQGKGIFGDDDQKPVDQRSVALKKNNSGSLNKLNTDAPVEVTCTGPFVFDAENQVAKFKDEVVVRRLVTNANPDRLLANILEVHFAKEEAETSDEENDSKPVTDKTNPAMGKMKIAKVIAIGNPVQLIAPSVDSTAAGIKLIYDVALRRVEITGKPLAILKKGTQEIRSPELQYEFAEDPEQLGQIWASGPGSFTGSIQPEDASRVEITWSNELRVDLVKQEHILTMDGDISILMPGEGHFQSDLLTLWMRSVADAKTKKYRLIPDRLHALGNVLIDSPRLSGVTPELKAWFQYAPVSTQTENRVPAQTIVHSPGQPLNPTGQPIELTVRPSKPASPSPKLAGRSPEPTHQSPQPANHNNNIVLTPPVDEKEPEPVKSKFHLVGEQIQLVMKQVGEEMQLENATVSGNVHVEETNLLEKDKQPFSVRGNVVQVSRPNSDQAEIHVIGDPGVVAGQGIQLYSKHLIFDQSESRVWTNGPGQIMLPMDRDFEGRRLAVPQLFTIVWQGRMEFNKDRLTFENGVEIQGRHHQLNTSRMVVTLDGPVNFRDLEGNFQPKTKRIECFDGVTMFGHTVENGQWLSQEYIEAKTLRINQLTGAILAHGPGYFRTTRFGFQNLAAAQSGGTSANVTNASPVSQQLGFLQVNFNREITGDIFKREISFHDVNQAVYGPVADWNDVINPNGAHGLGPDVIELSTQKLTVVQMEALRGKARPIELYATGNAQVNGQLFSAWADRITYSSTKGSLTLTGNGRNSARLTRQQQLGGSRQNLEAGTIMYRPKDGHFEMSNVKYIDVNNLQSFGSPIPNTLPR